MIVLLNKLLPTCSSTLNRVDMKERVRKINSFISMELTQNVLHSNILLAISNNDNTLA